MAPGINRATVEGNRAIVESNAAAIARGQRSAESIRCESV